MLTGFPPTVDLLKMFSSYFIRFILSMRIAKFDVGARCGFDAHRVFNIQ